MRASLSRHGHAFVIKFALFFVTSVTTYHLAEAPGFNPVLASALVGLVVSFVPSFQGIEKQDIHGAGFCGSFIGMCSIGAGVSLQSFCIMALVASGAFLLMRKQFVGVGGKLGMIAFISSLLAFGIMGQSI